MRYSLEDIMQQAERLDLGQAAYKNWTEMADLSLDQQSLNTCVLIFKSRSAPRWSFRKQQ